MELYEETKNMPPPLNFNSGSSSSSTTQNVVLGVPTAQFGSAAHSCRAERLAWAKQQAEGRRVSAGAGGLPAPLVFGDAHGDVFAYEADQATLCPCSPAVVSHLALPSPQTTAAAAAAAAAHGSSQQVGPASHASELGLTSVLAAKHTNADKDAVCYTSQWPETIFVHHSLPIVYDAHFNVFFEVPVEELRRMETAWSQLSRQSGP